MPTYKDPDLVADARSDSIPGIEAFMYGVRMVESGGRYNILGPVTKYGQVSGAYQFLNSTWGNYKGYRRAADAPPHIQDERARQLMAAYHREFGSWRLVAIAWHAGPGTARRVKRSGGRASTRDQLGTNTEDYAAKVLRTMEKYDGPGGAPTTGGYAPPPPEPAQRRNGAGAAQVVVMDGQTAQLATPDYHDIGTQMLSLVGIIGDPLPDIFGAPKEIIPPARQEDDGV